MIDRLAGQVSLDQLRLHRLHGQRAEVGGGGVTVQFIQWADGLADDVYLAGESPALDVVALGEVPIRRAQLDHGDC